MKIAALSSLLALASASVVAQFNLDTSKNAVGIAYSIWHSLGYKGTTPPDITEIQAGHGTYSGQGAWHFCTYSYMNGTYVTMADAVE